MFLRVVGPCALLTALLPLPLLAGAAALCDRAAERAAAATGVPVEVLLALTRTETGRAEGGTLTPWPWAVNHAGQGHWFDSAAEAQAWVQDRIDAGETNMDIGCFQLNLRWHAAAFPALDTMFDPEANARYAAEYLMQKYRDTGDWAAAAGAYHSATEAHADRYIARFSAVLAGLSPLQVAALDPAPVPRVNGFPLLMAGAGRGQGGSIVPQTGGGSALIGWVE